MEKTKLSHGLHEQQARKWRVEEGPWTLKDIPSEAQLSPTRPHLLKFLLLPNSSQWRTKPLTKWGCDLGNISDSNSSIASPVITEGVKLLQRTKLKPGLKPFTLAFHDRTLMSETSESLLSRPWASLSRMGTILLAAARSHCQWILGFKTKQIVF